MGIQQEAGCVQTRKPVAQTKKHNAPLRRQCVDCPAFLFQRYSSTWRPLRHFQVCKAIAIVVAPLQASGSRHLVITIENLIFEYPGHRALDQISVHIPAGSVTALVGPNGAGKSTLLRCLAGLERPLSGHIEVHGIAVIEQPRAVHQYMGYLSDFFGLFENLSVEQGLHYAALARGVEAEEAIARVQQVSQQLGIQELLLRKPGQLSRGQRQRLAIGQAIVHQPKVLLLDEPASGLDPDARDQLADLFRQLQAQGMTLVVSSHILSELDAYSTHVLSLRAGRIEHHAALQHQSNTADVAEAIYILEVAAPIAHTAPTLQEIALPRDANARAQRLSQLQAQGLAVAGLWPAKDSVQAQYLRGRASAAPHTPEVL